MVRENGFITYGRLGMIAVLIMILLGSTTMGKTYADGTRTVQLEKYDAISLPEIKANEVLNVEIQVTGGGPVDLLLIKASEYNNYKNDAEQRGKLSFINYITGGSLLNAESKSYTYTIKDAGDYYLVIDNTNVPYKGALPKDAVDMTLKVITGAQAASTTSPYNPQTTSGNTPSSDSGQAPKSPGFEAVIGIIAIAGLIFIRR